ncbi:MAG: fatty acid metabolism transcriptional regulator FadR [Ferrimonas sp.]
MIIQAKGAAGIAEEYIIKSIWNNDFAPGTILPAERELAEIIGVTRTTLREVLQRLARDGWLTIQHGKPTKVNNFWETSGLNILETLARLDKDGVPQLMDQLLSARTNISSIYIRSAVRTNPDKVKQLLASSLEIAETGEDFAEYDYQLNHSLAFISGNPIYTLILNGFRNLYSKAGGYYFSNSDARDLALKYYQGLSNIASEGRYDDVVPLVRQYGVDSGKIWLNMRDDLPNSIIEINN